MPMQVNLLILKFIFEILFVGYQCEDSSEHCCRVDGNFFCAPRWQNCYGYKYGQDFEKCQAKEGADDSALGRIAGKTTQEDGKISIIIQKIVEIILIFF